MTDYSHGNFREWTLVKLRMEFVESGSVLIGTTESCEPGILIVTGEEGERDRSAWTADVVVVAVVNRLEVSGRRRRAGRWGESAPGGR